MLKKQSSIKGGVASAMAQDGPTQFDAGVAVGSRQCCYPEERLSFQGHVDAEELSSCTSISGDDARSIDG